MARVVLIGGGTGVGTSRLAQAFTRALELPSPVSTDSIREVLRAALDHRLIPSLAQSTYLAGQTAHYAEKPQDVQRAEILRAYKNQCDAIGVGVDALIGRSQQENVSLTLEGVHLRPGASAGPDIQEFLIHIPDYSIHRERFLARAREAPARSAQRYLDNFREIRWIHDYLVEKAQATPHITLIDNSCDVAASISAMIRAYSQR